MKAARLYAYDEQMNVDLKVEQVDEPKMTAPDASSRSIAPTVSAGTKPTLAREPAVLSTPAIHCESLVVTGTPQTSSSGMVSTMC